MTEKSSQDPSQEPGQARDSAEPSTSGTQKAGLLSRFRKDSGQAERESRDSDDPPGSEAAGAPEETTATQRDTDAPGDCVVVGVGASAGGLSAYKRLLRHMPADTGMAFVLVQHLDPTHESLMVELLSKYTTMPVQQVQNATPVEPNHIYMIPPNKFIRIRNGGLYLEKPVPKRGVRLPIDYFFESLAEARQERAIGIVLSGTGSDGAAGCREIKAAGGLTVVEKPELAEYDGMPRAAIATGSIDFILPIEDIADVVVPYARHPYVQTEPNATIAVSAPDHFRAILSLLRAHTDQDFTCYKTGTLTRRIERRMSIRHIKDPSAYLKLLRSEHDEVYKLFTDLLIGVTRFFRDEEAWQVLEQALATRIADKRPNESVRVWVPGCSSGEEAYSIAILIFELLARQHKPLDVQIFATDIDANAIEAARQGVYLDSIAKDLPTDKIDRYFTREGDKLRVKKRIRESCVFAVQNLLSDPPFSNLDLISCRNLLIYLEGGVQGKVMDLFHFALRPSGLLFLGSSESPTRRKNNFKAISQSARLYEKLGASKPGGGAFPVTGEFRRQAREKDDQVDYRTGPAVSMGTAEISRRTLLDQFAPASVVVNHHGLIQYIHGAVKNYLEFPSGEPDLDLCTMAHPSLKGRTRRALQLAREKNETVSVVAPRVNLDGKVVSVRIRVQPLPKSRDREWLFLVSFFDEAPPVKPQSEAPEPAAESAQAPAAEILESDAADASEDASDATSPDRLLAQELQATREDLQSTIEELESANEELKASNEEVMSMNEELQSTNEELETSREELQSLNEELSTVNNQLHDKVEELEATNNDLANLLASTDMATLFLDEELRIRRFTPATVRLMSLIDTDIGRPLSDLAPRVADPHMVEDARQVLESLLPREREVKNGGGHWYMRRITPFRTSENKIQGVVVTFSDVTSLKDSSARLEARERQQALIAQLGRKGLAGARLMELYELAVEGIAEVLNIEFTKLLRLEQQGKRVRLVAGVGWDDDIVGEATINTGLNSQAGYTLQTSGPVISYNLAKEKRFTGPDLLVNHGVVSGMSVLIGPEDRPWGVLGAHTRIQREFNVDDTNFLQAVANVLWEAIERRRTESRARKRAAELTNLYNTSPIGLVFIDTNLRYVRVNENMARINGLPVEDHLGKRLQDVLPDLADTLMPVYQKVIDTGKPIIGLEVSGTTPAAPDEVRHWLVNYSPVLDGGKLIGINSAVIDITDQKRAEEELTNSRRRLQRLVDTASVGIAFVEHDGTIVQANDEMLNIFGITREEFDAKGWDWERGVLPADQGLANAMRRLSETREREIIELRRRDGDQPVWVLASAQPLGSTDKSDYVAFIVDITAQKQAELALARSEELLRESEKRANLANETKSEFLANMSHEIRTPMSAIMGYADTLHKHLKDPDNISCVEVIRKNGQFLVEIIDDILDISRIEAGKVEIANDVVRVDRLLADVYALMEFRASEKKLEFKVKIEGRVPQSVKGDYKRLKQILVNLLGNAIKFTRKGSVELNVQWLGDEASPNLFFRIVDTGIGIEPESLERLFAPFTQADATVGRSYGGTGLGLAISQRLAQMMGGKISVDSTPDAGSTFSFAFTAERLGSRRLEDFEESLQSLLQREATGPASSGIRSRRIEGRILVVDDRSEIRFIARSLLEEAGARVEECENGEQAVQLVTQAEERGEGYNLILMDIQMPTMDGYEATREIRQRGYDKPIIALTAHAMEGDRQACLDAGCDDYITKPLEGMVFLELVAKHLDKSEGQNESTAGVSTRILIVDDNEDAGRAIQKILLMEGHDVELAFDGEAALRAMKETTPEIVLLDLTLPDMSGFEVLELMRQIQGERDIRYVAITGHQNSRKIEQAGFDQYFIKPVMMRDLLQWIRQNA